MLKIIQKTSRTHAILECARCSTHYERNLYDAQKSRCGHMCATCRDLVAHMNPITQEKLQDAFTYDPLTGHLCQKWPSFQKNAGERVGYSHSAGYRSVFIGGGEQLEHRLIWKMVHGRWPIEIDHIDHNRSNNRLDNLREATSLHNARNTGMNKNNTNGVRGVRKLPSGRYCAYIMVSYKQKSLGTFDEIEDAIAARKEGEALYGFHKNHGK